MLETTEMNFICGQLDGDYHQVKKIFNLIKPHFTDLAMKLKKRLPTTLI